MDISLIGKPHEWDPRRVYSQTGADWQYRVDFARLRRDRLLRLKEQMSARDVGAVVLFAGANIRSVTEPVKVDTVLPVRPSLAEDTARIPFMWLAYEADIHKLCLPTVNFIGEW